MTNIANKDPVKATIKEKKSDLSRRKKIDAQTKIERNKYA
jgi:hypothetical protein